MAQDGRGIALRWRSSLYVMFNSNISKYSLLALFLSVMTVFSGSYEIYQTGNDYAA